MMRVLSYFILSVLISMPVSAGTTSQPVMHDYSSGLFRFQKTLAKRGNSDAQYKLGDMYEKGIGTTKDKNKAQIWFEKAAAQGHNKAKYKLLYLDLEVNGLTAENKKQIELLHTKAEEKNTDAQYYLGKMYATGVGVQKDLSTALTWFNIATFNGDSEAEDEAIAIDEALSQNNVDEFGDKGLIAAQQAAEQLEIEKKQVAKKIAADEKRAQSKKKKQHEKARANKLAKDKARKKQQAQNALNAALLEEREMAEREVEVQRLLELALAEEEASKLEAERIKAAKMKEKERVRVSTFKSNPCQGKSAKFLSICR